jgi:hypothetical protein
VIVTTTFQRKTFVVQAKQVKVEDMLELAAWCGGEYIHSYTPVYNMESGNYRIGQPCIEVTVDRVTGRKIRAFVGDWLTHIHGSNKFKVYRDATFKEAFEEVLRDIPEEVMRRIVREEMRSLLQSMGKTAFALSDGLASYEIGELERSGHQAIRRVAELEEAMLPHAWNCEVRNPAGWDHKCSCGVGDEL